MWYNLDYNRLAVLLTPSFLRKPIFVAFTQALLSPITTLHYQWLQKREFDWYRLKHNGQRCKLRKVINDQLDASLRRIYIGEGNSFPQEYIYTEQEIDKQWLDDTLYIYTEEQYENTGVDFTVFVPTEIIDTSIHQLKYLLQYYKLAGKRYKIEPI